MKPVYFAVLITAASIWGVQNARAAAGNAPAVISASASNASLRYEVDHAVDKGLAWLQTKQDTNGVWSTDKHPAITALVVSAFKGAPQNQGPSAAEAVRKGYAYLLSCAQPDGGIYREGLATYNTSVVLMALALANRDEYRSAIANGRRFLIGLQADYSQAGGTNSVFNGGISYGSLKDKRPDLANTSQVLEALYYTKNLGEQKGAPAADLNWQAAIHFVQSCQNLPGYNPQKWVADDPADKGGFVYLPGRSNAGQTNLPDGRTALRSYGSISYDGLLSYIYADLKFDDPRVSGVVDWLRHNFTVEENPGLGQQGIYYYYFVMAKALALYGTDQFQGKGGESINWREQLALKLMNRQAADGSWVNDNARWWEKDPVLDSACAVLTLEILERKL